MAIKTSIGRALVQKPRATVKRHRTTAIKTNFNAKVGMVCNTSIVSAGKSAAINPFMILVTSRSDVSLYSANSVSGSSA